MFGMGVKIICNSKNKHHIQILYVKISIFEPSKYFLRVGMIGLFKLRRSQYVVEHQKFLYKRTWWKRWSLGVDLFHTREKLVLSIFFVLSYISQPTFTTFSSYMNSSFQKKKSNYRKEFEKFLIFSTLSFLLKAFFAGGNTLLK